jgi:hypothetical protein
MRLVVLLLLLITMGSAVYAQRPRAIETSTATDASKATPAPPPANMKAKYEGGIFGYNRTMEGWLSFDDTNQRLMFRDKRQKEVLFIPYSAVHAAFSDTQKRRPAAATVAQHIPYIGFPLGFIKKKVRYLTLQYSDKDTNMAGVTSFRLENQATLDSVVYALANRAGLSPRGQIYVRKNESAEVKKVGP